MLPSLTTLPGPDREYLDSEELSRWLDIDRKTLRKYVRAKALPAGKPRMGGSRHYWTREAAAICKWILDHLDRFSGEVETPKPKPDGRNLGKPPTRSE
jgi:hypothetical protein